MTRVHNGFIPLRTYFISFKLAGPLKSIYCVESSVFYKSSVGRYQYYLIYRLLRCFKRWRQNPRMGFKNKRLQCFFSIDYIIFENHSCSASYPFLILRWFGDHENSTKEGATIRWALYRKIKHRKAGETSHKHG